MKPSVKKLTVRLACAAAAIALLTTSEPALAWKAKSCDGKIMGQRSKKTYRLNRCSIAQNSTREGDVIYAMREWNNIYGMYDRFGWTDGPTSCSITSGDGKWDVGFTSRSNIDGAHGVTLIKVEACVWPYPSSWDGGYVEADVLIASTGFDNGETACDTETQLPRRGVIIHELGHALGALHDDRSMSVMNTSGEAYNIIGKYCGPHTMAPHPDDVAFALKYHRSSNNSWEFGASGFYLPAENNRSLTMSPGTTYVCPGDRIWYRYSYGNRGTRNIGTTKLKGKIALSTNTTISNFDIPVAYWTLGAGKGSFRTNSGYLTVPSTVRHDTTYYIGVYLDYQGTFAETHENNNTTYLARRLRVRSASACR